jgi:peptide/nickel transport system permease protein
VATNDFAGPLAMTIPEQKKVTDPVARRKLIDRVLRLSPAGLVGLLAIAGPWIALYDPTKVVGPTSAPPSANFWFGTDTAGLDVYSQLVSAARLDLVMALAVIAIATGVGIVLGLLLGMNEAVKGPLGLATRGIARIVDFMQAVPAVIFGLVAVSFYGQNATTLVFAVGLALCPVQVRLVRTEVLRVRSEAYLEAARLAGLSEFELTVRHVLPNSCWPAIENATVLFGTSIIIMSALGFIGVGLPPPAPEWGSMMSRGATDAAVGRWWSAGFPAAALALTVASVALAATALFPKRRV